MNQINYEKVYTKSKVLNLYKFPDPWFWINGSINPYRGCEHNCVYCDGKSKYYRISDYGSRIRVKINTPQKLEKELLSLGFKPINRVSKTSIISYLDNNLQEKDENKYSICYPVIAVGGGVCDVYQPAEAKFKITEKILKILYDFNIPITVLTKSKLILRDINIFKKYVKTTYVNIAFSISIVDKSIQKLIEPKASTVSERIEALRKFKGIGCTTGIMAMPLLPILGDNEENIRKIVEIGAEINVDYILFSGLTLKEGNKEEFFNFLDNYFPNLKSLYQKLYFNTDRYGAPKIPEDYQNINFMKIAHQICEEYGIPDRMPRYIPDCKLKNNMKVSEILHNIAYIKQWILRDSWYSYNRYISVANKIEKYPEPIENLSVESLCSQYKISKKFAELIQEIIKTGKSSYYEKLKKL